MGNFTFVVANLNAIANRDLVVKHQYHPIDGNTFVEAIVFGIEVECRIGNAVYPQHYDIGWHITGTAGTFGAAAAIGKLIGLTEQQMTWALGIAATQASA